MLRIALTPRSRPADVLGQVGEEALDQQEDVLAPLAERRQADLEDAQAVVEVLAEAAAFHRRLGDRDWSRRSRARRP